MTNIHEGQIAPSFTLLSHDNQIISLKDFLGKPIILYFYPKDNTQGCTLEARAFSDIYSEILERNIILLGVSPDLPAVHKKFIAANNLSFTLLSDVDHTVSQLYGVWKEMHSFGKTYWSTTRSTFIINKELKIIKIISGVKPEEHAPLSLEVAKNI